MQFPTGQSGNPAGKPKGAVSGRTQIVKALDRLLQDEGNQQALLNGLEASLQKDPVWFFRRIIMPLLPKEASVNIEYNGVVTWLSLSDTIPTEVKNASMMPAISDFELSVPDDDSERPSALPERCLTAPENLPATTDG
jgi:hypothetical protein